MHELSVANALIEQLERIALDHGADRVARVVITIGPLSGVEPELLRQAYPLAAAGSRADAAELIIETAAVVVACSQCGSESNAAANHLLCAECGDFRTRVVSGDEMLLQTVELELENGRTPAGARGEAESRRPHDGR